MLKNGKTANRNIYQNRKTDVFRCKNRKTDLKNGQNRETENPNAPLSKEEQEQKRTLSSHSLLNNDLKSLWKMTI